MSATRTQVIATGIAIGAAGGVFTLSLIGSIIGIPMILIGLVFIAVGALGRGADFDDAD